MVGPASSSVQEATFPSHTWSSHQRTVSQAVELLPIQGRQQEGRAVPPLVSCPCMEDEALDATGLDTSLPVLHQGMPIHEWVRSPCWTRSSLSPCTTLPAGHGLP
jgi:hypothetical protein